MTFSQYCDMVENTEQEQAFFQFLRNDEMKAFESSLRKLTRIPVLGELFAALIELKNYESLAEFKESEHYANIRDWNFKVNTEKGTLIISPGDIHLKQIKKIAAIIGVSVALLAICKKLRSRGK